jgi:hypothetical protein
MNTIVNQDNFIKFYVIMYIQKLRFGQELFKKLTFDLYVWSSALKRDPKLGRDTPPCHDTRSYEVSSNYL